MSQSPVSRPAPDIPNQEKSVVAVTEHLGELPTGQKDSAPTDRRMDLLRIIALLIITLGSLWLALNPEWVRSFGRWGYLSVFFISLLSSATVLIPAPGLAVVFAMGRALDPVTLGIVAGIGSGLGELSGYIAGASGRGLILHNKNVNSRLHWFTTRHTYPALFVLAALPMPVFDLAGVMAGAMKMRVSHFLTIVISGKIVKHILVAMVGAGSWGLFRHMAGL